MMTAQQKYADARNDEARVRTPITASPIIRRTLSHEHMEPRVRELR